MAQVRKDIDVNGLTEIAVINEVMPITPLIMAISQSIYGQCSYEIVLMLLKAGAKIDLEIDCPKFDKSMALIGWGKTTARLVVEEIVKSYSEESLETMDETIRQGILECRKKASDLLEIVQSTSTKS